MSNFDKRVMEVVDPKLREMQALFLPGEGVQAPDTSFVRLIQDIKTEVASTEKIVKEISAFIDRKKGEEEEEKGLKERIKDKGIQLFEPKQDNDTWLDKALDALKEYFKQGQEFYSTADSLLDVLKEYFKYKFRNKAWDIENILRLIQAIVPFIAAVNVVDALRPQVLKTHWSTQRIESQQKKDSKKLDKLEQDLLDCCEQQAGQQKEIKDMVETLLKGPQQSLEILSRTRAIQSSLEELRRLL